MLSVIIPVYNEEGNLQALHSRLKQTLEGLDTDYELIFVNDHSRDASFPIIISLANENPSVKYISFSRNFGHQIAVSAGLDRCRGDYVAIIDADLQDPPELIGDMFHKMKEGFDVVYAKRRKRDGEGFLKKLTAKVFYKLLARITTVEIPVDTGDFRMVSKRIVHIIRQMPEQHKYLRGQIAWAGFEQTSIEYDRAGRNAGETGYTYRKMIRFALDGITSFSRFPLKVASMTGFVVSGISFFIILYTLYSKFIMKDAIQGWTSIMLTVTFLGGIQLICIGIIGEYLGRISDNVRNRPLYVINESNLDAQD